MQEAPDEEEDAEAVEETAEEGTNKIQMDHYDEYCEYDDGTYQDCCSAPVCLSINS